jgi:hypothetical protein
MKFIVWILLLFITQIGNSQSIDWQKTSQWKLYDMKGQDGLRYSVDTLSNFKSLNLDIDTLHHFLFGVQLWPTEEYSMWMGGFVVSCEDQNGIIRKLDVSAYAGFFFDNASKRYYQIKEEDHREWLDFFHYQSTQFQNH